MKSSTEDGKGEEQPPPSSHFSAAPYPPEVNFPLYLPLDPTLKTRPAARPSLYMCLLNCNMDIHVTNISLYSSQACGTGLMSTRLEASFTFRVGNPKVKRQKQAVPGLNTCSRLPLHRLHKKGQ